MEQSDCVLGTGSTQPPGSFLKVRLRLKRHLFNDFTPVGLVLFLQGEAGGSQHLACTENAIRGEERNKWARCRVWLCFCIRCVWCNLPNSQGVSVSLIIIIRCYWAAIRHPALRELCLCGQLRMFTSVRASLLFSSCLLNIVSFTHTHTQEWRSTARIERIEAGWISAAPHSCTW